MPEPLKLSRFSALVDIQEKLTEVSDTLTTLQEKNYLPKDHSLHFHQQVEEMRILIGKAHQNHLITEHFHRSIQDVVAKADQVVKSFFETKKILSSMDGFILQHQIKIIIDDLD